MQTDATRPESCSGPGRVVFGENRQVSETAAVSRNEPHTVRVSLTKEHAQWQSLGLECSPKAPGLSAWSPAAGLLEGGATPGDGLAGGALLSLCAVVSRAPSQKDWDRKCLLGNCSFRGLIPGWPTPRLRAQGEAELLGEEPPEASPSQAKDVVLHKPFEMTSHGQEPHMPGVEPQDLSAQLAVRLASTPPLLYTPLLLHQGMGMLTLCPGVLH